MRCYYCGAELDDTDFCPECEADIHIWKKIYASSNLFYNEGLEKAKIRNLSGAVESLQMSLRYNKLNIDARNLLGLIYYEMGETVTAISEWVISKSLMAQDNPADRYLNEIQKSASQQDKIKKTIQKFNQALIYCKQGDDDLALIQLKKVLNLNPKMVRAYQLEALMYMKQGHYDKALKALRHADEIDAKNTTTMRYARECRDSLKAGSRKKAKKEEAVTYQSGNDFIIRPVKMTDNTAVLSVINLLIGALIGIAVIWFLVIPEIRQNAQNEANSQVVAINETVSAKDDTISGLESQIEELQSQLSTAEESVETADNKTASYSSLMEACKDYLAGDYSAAGQDLTDVDSSLLEENAKAVYDSIYANVEDQLLADSYQAARKTYAAKDFPEAITQLSEIVEQDQTYENGEAAFYLAFSYYYNGDGANALKWFQFVASNTTDSQMKQTSADTVDYLKQKGYTATGDTAEDTAETETQD